VAIPSTVVGGIGVILNVYDAKEGMKLIQVNDVSIRAGKKIDMGTSVRLLEDEGEEQKLLQSMADGYHNRFKQVVSQARPSVKKELFDGRVMTGPQALEAGLVDTLGYLDDALRIAGTLAKVEQAMPVMYRRSGDAARTLYATTPNRPIHTQIMPMSIPGMDRSKLPLFLYMWQPEPTLMKVSGL
jgi:protease-4